MRAERELREKISEYMELLPKIKSEVDHERYCMVIDALLWAVGDNEDAIIYQIQF